MSVFVTFTCARDADLLQIWAAGIRKIDPTADLVAAIDAADEKMPLPSGVKPLITQFERGGNLNGLGCVTGIVATIGGLAGLSGQPVVKIDSDTILCGRDWLRPVEDGQLDFIGFEGMFPMTASGLCYALTANGANTLLRVLSHWPWTTGNMAEDRIISHMATMYLGARSRIVPWGQGEHVRSITPQAFGEPQKILGTSVAIHCAQEQTLAAYGTAPRTALVRRAMRHVLRCRAGRCDSVSETRDPRRGTINSDHHPPKT